MEPQSTATRRLVRRSHDRYLAGVAGGVADYFAIDPVLVRIAFVVLTFVGGAGAIAYAAGWLLIPEEGETASLGEDALRNHNWGRIAGFALIAIAASLLLRPLWWFGGHLITAVALILLGVYLLSHRGGSDTSTDTTTPPTAPTAPPAPEPPGSPTTSTAHLLADESTVETSTSAWPPPPPPPPTGAWPPPPPPLPPRPAPRGRQRRRSGASAMTFGILLVGAGVIGLILAAGNGVEPTRVFAGGLLVVGGALVATTWFGRGGVLIPLGLLLVGLLSVSSLIDVPFKGGFGERIERPTTSAELKREYHLAAGELTIDLGQMTFPRGSTTDIEATVGAGHLVVIVPRGVEVDMHGHAGAGEVRFLGDDGQGGVRVDRDTQLQAGEGAARVDLDARVGLGQVEVRDAAS